MGTSRSLRLLLYADHVNCSTALIWPLAFMHLFGTLWINASQSEGPDYGVSEQYPLIATNYVDGDTALTNILTARRAMLPPDAHIVYRRVSDGDVRGDSYRAGPLDDPGTFVSAQTFTFLADVCLRVLAEAGTLHRGTRFIRCLPVDVFSALGQYTPTTAWTTAYNAWSAVVLANCAVAKRIGTFPVTPAWSFSNITSMSNPIQTNKKAGRPFGTLRGRRLVA